MVPTWSQKGSQNGAKIDAEIDLEPKWRLGRPREGLGTLQAPFWRPFWSHFSAKSAPFQRAPKAFQEHPRASKNLQRRRFESQTDEKLSSTESSSRTQTSERLARKRGGGGRRRRASSIIIGHRFPVYGGKPLLLRCT